MAASSCLCFENRAGLLYHPNILKRGSGSGQGAILIDGIRSQLKNRRPACGSPYPGPYSLHPRAHRRNPAAKSSSDSTAGFQKRKLLKRDADYCKTTIFLEIVFLPAVRR